MVGTPASASAPSSSGPRGGEWIVHKRHIAAASWERFRSAKPRAIEGCCPRGSGFRGPIPQAVYGHQAMGLSPSSILALRRQAPQSVASKSPGRCLAT
eukprot:3163467-Pyramimonas_sp.AAC.1